jgi:dTDP-4-dehydrorhamnose reductase
MFEKTSYDQIYDEHIFMFSATSVKKIFSLFDMELIDLIKQETHGGSMRYVISRKKNRSINSNVKRILAEEKKLNLDNVESCLLFKKKCEESKIKLQNSLKNFKLKGKKIVGYAATSKSTTILNYCKIGPQIIDYICDTTPEKIGKYSPGMHIPIVSTDYFRNDNPDIAYLFAWNHKKEILKKEKFLKKIILSGFPMSKFKKRIVFSGSSGRFGKVLQETSFFNYKVFFPSRSELDITNNKSIEKYFKKIKPDIFVHMAALSRPMNIHDSQINKSINLNIIGTSNITCACYAKKIKLIYFSTQYVYPGTKGNYKETDSLYPVNNYAWSKLGGECAVQMYKNSLIIRLSMTEKPFLHKKAFADVKTNFIYHEDVVPILKKILNKKGIINVGGPTQTIFNFAIKNNPNVKKIFAKKINRKFPLNPSMNLQKLNKIIKQ